MNDKTIQTGLEAILREAMTLARQAPPSRADFKAAQDYVTDVDLAVDAFLAEKLSALTPDTPVLSEERAVEETGELDGYWIVDPIDGTMNLMCRIPFVGISVALVDAKGPRIAAVASVADGVIYSTPALDITPAILAALQARAPKPAAAAPAKPPAQ